MNIKLEYFPEPKLQFGHYFEHEDTKTGLAEYGPFGKNIDGLHPKEIRLGFIGTRETIAGCREWVEQCGQAIESENIKRTTITPSLPDVELFENGNPLDAQTARYEKILNRDFIGFNPESQFQCAFVTNERWIKTVLPGDIAGILQTPDKQG
ncbi:MAG TPA: hypothetical protein VME43_27590 [Bryobacteraceae bacterium]|nr:hypothetical protein [Bryobacteraceae bacterium]